MRQIRILFLSALFIFAVITVLISTVAVSGQQVVSSGSPPADIVYAQPGQLVDQAAKPSPKEASRTAGAR
jgi:hypothetical protein